MCWTTCQRACSQRPKANCMKYGCPKKSGKALFWQVFTKLWSKYPKAVECLEKNRDGLLIFYNFPAEHLRHIRTNNPIEFTFSTVRLRTDKVRGYFSSQIIVTMVLRLGQCAQKRWLWLHHPDRLAEVIKSVSLVNGILINGMLPSCLYITIIQYLWMKHNSRID